LHARRRTLASVANLGGPVPVVRPVLWPPLLRRFQSDRGDEKYDWCRTEAGSAVEKAKNPSLVCDCVSDWTDDPVSMAGEPRGPFSKATPRRRQYPSQTYGLASNAGSAFGSTPRRTLTPHRSPPPQNETTDTGQIDGYQREQAYDGTQMVCDARALAYRMVHRVTQKEPCRGRAEKEVPFTGGGPPCRSKNVHS
jgi:hypothetical protein